jgi:hypothetical protein
MSEIVKTCQIHGLLTIEQTRKEKDKFRCKQCRIDTNKKTYYKHREKRVSTSMKWKRDNRGDYNEWCRQDRIKNPDKYRKYEENKIIKYGKKKFVTQDIINFYKISLEDYEKMFEVQKNLCVICKNVETRMGRSGEVARLCVDHCHTCKENDKPNIRGLLCHSCNTAIGKFKDNIELLENAINYLKTHQCN